MSVIFSTLVLWASVAPSLVVGASVRTRSCPLANCPNANNEATSLMQLSSMKSRSTTGCGEVFKPAHFTCSSCDRATCKGCNNVICDLSKCIGKFYKQECWCKKPLGETVDKFFCDDDCTGGLCNTQGLTCKTREKACKPWWWCKLPPPKEPEKESFLQKMASRRQGGCAARESTEQLNRRLEQSKAQLKAASLLQESNRAVKRQIEEFDFQPGEWVCESALLPKPDEDPVTLIKSPAGFVVLDGNTCSGGYFKSKCYCYDKFKYFKGEDPMTSELDCDDGCGLGECAGKTCGKLPPPPLPKPPPPPPIDPLAQELANEGMLKNYGTQMSPVS